MKFKSVSEMVNWLLNNEGSVLRDGYGRSWFYKGYAFWFKDIGSDSIYQQKLDCLHLFGTIRVPEKEASNG